MRCPNCGTATWYGDETGAIRCALGHPKTDAKTKVRTVRSAKTKTVEPTPEPVEEDAALD